MNHPTFGTGLTQLLFNPNSAELASTLQFLVTGALQQWLGDLIEVADVVIGVEDSTLTVHITYSERGSQTIREAIINRTI